MYVTDPCVSCGMRQRIPTLNLNLILNPKLDLISKLITVALLPTRPRDPIYTHSHSRISTLSHTHTEGSWKKCEEAKHFASRRAAEDAPVTAQHDVPRWVRGRWRPAAVRLRGWAVAAAPGRIFTFTGCNAAWCRGRGRPRGWMAVGCRRQRAQRPSKHCAALGTRPEPPAHGNAAEARGCTDYASRSVFRLSPLPEAGSSDVGREFK